LIQNGLEAKTKINKLQQQKKEKELDGYTFKPVTNLKKEVEKQQ
jgi:hypothetical protein